MKFQVVSGNPLRVHSDALAIGLFANDDSGNGDKLADRALGGQLKDMRKRGEIRGREGEAQVVVSPRGAAAKRVVLVGLGKRDEFGVSGLQKLAGVAVRSASARDFKSVAVVIPDGFGFDPQRSGELLAEGAIMATFDPASYRSKREERTDAVSTLFVVTEDESAIPALRQGIVRGTLLGEAANDVRTMVNVPSNDMRPTDLADRARELAKKAGLKLTVLERNDMKKMGMGSFLSVAAGSDEPPKMIALEYRGDKASKTVLGLVGKGITFDTGGISLKPAQNMEAMKGDMAGGATVLGAMSVIGRLKPKVNVIGIVCATENMPSGHATKPGDVVRAMNGKTIEINNTDAEGRLVLADGLCWARKLGATQLVDIATLTGAVVIALGSTTTGVMSNDRDFADLFHDAARPYGERYWDLPIYPEYAELIKSQIADMKNSGGREAGTIYGAMFIKEFVDDVPWIHLDIAGTSWTEKDNGHLAKGPTAVALRPLVRLAELVSTHQPHAKADNAAYKRWSDGAA